MCDTLKQTRAAVKIYCRVHPEKACYVHIGNVLIFLKTKVLLLNNVLTLVKIPKNQGGYKTETAVSLQQFCLQIQLDSDNLLGPLLV